MELENRQDERTRYYRSFIEPLLHDMGPFLENIKCTFPEYPDHGIQHSLRILDYLAGIISSDLLAQLSSLDIFVLIYSALFHDSAMALFNVENIEKETIRNQHALKAKEVISRYFDSYLLNLSEKDRIEKAVIFVCEAHGLMLGDLIRDKRFRIEDRVNTLPIHYGILAFLLRIGDLMDLEAERANNFRMMMFCDDFSALSREHNMRHLKVDVYNYNPSQLEITVIAKNKTQYRIWDDWFSFLKDDLEKFNALYAREGLYLPNLKAVIQSPSGTNYEVQSLRFEIDDKGGLWDIISQSIYTNELDFVRELLQNSIDASLKVVYQNSATVLDHVSPRSWGSGANSVVVLYSEKEKTLCVIDYGIGMDSEDLKNYLFKVSSTGKVSCDKRSFEFPGIAQYGIGFVSCLINADNIELYTRKSEGKTYKVSLENGRNYAFIETQTNSDKYIGTSVVLKLKQQFSYSEISNYIATTFVYPSVSIQIINTDKAMAILGEGINDFSGPLFRDKPYEFVALLHKKQEEYAPILRELYESNEKVREIQRHLEELSLYYKENHQRINSIDHYSEYNLRVQDFLSSISNVEIRRKLKNLTLTRKMLNQFEEEQAADCIINAFDDSDRELENNLARLRKQIEEHLIPIIGVENRTIDDQNDWKYLVAKFDSNLELIDIVKTNDPISLKRGSGIVLIRHREIDYDFGIEYIAINGFMFYHGRVCNRLIRLTHIYDDDYSRRHPKSFTIGVKGGFDYIRDAIQEFTDEEYEEQVYDFDDTYDDYDGILSAFDGNREASFDNLYDEISIENNEINKNLERDINFHISVFNHQEADDKYIRGELLTARALLKEAAREMQEIILSDKHAFYQDGIAIPSRLNSIFPMGFFRIKCNCTANARMKLNITRHKPSEIRSDVEGWISVTGRKIQEKILRKLEEAWEELNLSVSYEDVIWEQKENMDYFELESRRSLSSIIKDMGYGLYI